uniref:NADH-ubiquinone oxidoreductase chain 4L n=1 Tax=Pseudhymenochirus merlini TaxID=864177 RepID=F6KDB3_9PIPI|nr:NADH dehydrogenase subunit 4L [Pseudhymenochirus merlini]ADM35704.1 NADH dehydrogenase subunit 4L [Pseudhymenochirus merlini]
MTPVHFTFCSSFALSLTGLVLHRTHLLSALLCLEGVMLSLYIGLSAWPTNLHLSSSFITPLLMLTFSACEAGAGLSLMIATTRTHGSDNLNNLNLLQC